MKDVVDRQTSKRDTSNTCLREKLRGDNSKEKETLLTDGQQQKMGLERESKDCTVKAWSRTSWRSTAVYDLPWGIILPCPPIVLLF